MAVADSIVDLMLPVKNRAEFTRECLSALRSSTTWKHIRKFTVYNVASIDGARDVIAESMAGFTGCPFEIVDLPSVGVAEVMNRHMKTATAPFVAKLDNDTLLPPKWLEVAFEAFVSNPDLWIVGLEAFDEIPPKGFSGPYNTKPAEFVGGLFLARTQPFKNLPPPVPGGPYFGFTEWQKGVAKGLKKGWLVPSIPTILLDRLPFEPWLSYTKRYVTAGWQRPWPCYPETSRLWQWRFPFVVVEKFVGPIEAPEFSAVVQSDARGLRVDLGCSDSFPPGFDRYVDIVEPKGAPEGTGMSADLTKTWPFKDNEVSYFRAKDIIEHLPNKIHTMNEIWRCLSPGGTVEIIVPTFGGVGAVCDPQHISLWSRASFDYFAATQMARKRFADSYGIKASFSIVSEEKKTQTKHYPSGDEKIEYLRIVLSAQKQVDAPYVVVIPSNSSERLRRSVGAILAKNPSFLPSKILVVDDGAKVGWMEGDPKVTWIDGVKPFVYSRNVNQALAVVPKGADVILLGDDTEVLCSFEKVSSIARGAPGIGIVSFGISGPVGNPQQQFRANGSTVECSDVGLAFVAVYITAGALERVGPLDERFVGYGCEDKDWCLRVKKADLKLLIDQTSEVRHNAPGMSSAWRTKPDIHAQHQHNKKLYEEKWSKA